MFCAGGWSQLCHCLLVLRAGTSACSRGETWAL